MRAVAILLLATLATSLSFAAETSDPPTLLTIRGKLLKEEGFKDQASVDKGNKGGWGIYKGKFEVVDGELKVTEQKEDNHHPAMSCKLPATNLIMQCRFKVGDSKWQGLSLDNGKLKEHIFRAMFNPTSVTMTRMSGMGGTTKGETIVSKKFKFEKDKWYTLIVELYGKEVCAQIPEASITIYGEHDAIAAEKDRFELIAGGDNAWFDDVKVWDAEANPKWAETKAALPKPPAPKRN